MAKKPEFGPYDPKTRTFSVADTAPVTEPALVPEGE